MGRFENIFSMDGFPDFACKALKTLINTGVEQNDQSAFYLPRQYLPESYGGICYEEEGHGSWGGRQVLH